MLTVTRTIMQVKGNNGTVDFDGQWITIRRTGLGPLTIGKGDKRIHIGSITAVQMKPAGALTNGYIEFTVPGGREKRATFGRQTLDAAENENAVIFTKKQQAEFESLRAAVEQAIAASRAPQQPVSQPQAGLADQLDQLARLHAAGVLSDQEFQAAKARLIA